MGEHTGTWDLLLSGAKFAYNISVNKTTGMSPFEIVHDHKARKPTNLITLLLHARSFESAKSFA